VNTLTKYYTYLLHDGGSEGFKKYLRNTGWSFFPRLGTLILSFFVTIAVIRYLGPTNYGALSYAISFVSLFGFIASLGIDQIIYRELVSRPKEEAVIMGTSILLKALAGTLAASLAVTIALFLETPQIELILISIISLSLIVSSWRNIAYIYLADVQAKYPSVISLAIAVILAIFKVIIIFLDKGIIYFAIVQFGESILYAILFSYFYVKHYGSIARWKFDLTVSKELLRKGFPLLLSTVSVVIYARIDQVMLRHFIDVKAVGIYDAAVRLSDVWYIIPTVLVSSLFPAIVNALTVSPQLFRARILKLSAVLAVLIVLVALPASFFSDWIIRTLYGEAFIESAFVLKIYIWSLLGYGIGQVMFSYLIAVNKGYVYLVSTTSTMIINVVLNILLIPKYGINGAALATLISYSLLPIIPFAYKEIRVQLLTLGKKDSSSAERQEG